MAILKYLGIVFYAARARAETERTPLVPLVSIRELHEDFSGNVDVEPRDSFTVLLENVVHIEGSVHVGYFSSRYECPDVAPRFTSIHLPKLETIGRDLVISSSFSSPPHIW